MQSDTSPEKIANVGKRAFEKGDFKAAIQAFTQAADAYAADSDTLSAAELKNNLSVSLFKCKRTQEALDAAAGTDQVFAQVGDTRRQAIAIGNQAAALEALGRNEEAIDAYERSAELFAQTGDGDLQSLVLRSEASLKLRSGKFTDTAITMLGSLEVAKKPSLLQHLLKLILRLNPFSK